MLTLKNIKIDNNIISANYIPEDSEESGFLKYDYVNNIVLEENITSFDTTIPIYLHHAKVALKRYVVDNEKDSEMLVMWH